MEIFSLYGKYYAVFLILQIICVVHCIRKGNQQQWIWLIVFLPAIGCLIYLFMEIITKRDVAVVQSNLDKVIRPTGRIKDLKRELEFSDTFENRMALAQAYLHSGMYNEAIELYEASLTGIFANNPHEVMQLMAAYFEVERYADVIELTQRVKNSPDFVKSHARVCFALSLEKTGQLELAENEFVAMKGRFSNYEARFTFGQFLMRRNRTDEAKAIYTEILSEASRMTRGESRNSRHWFQQTKEAMGKLNA